MKTTICAVTDLGTKKKTNQDASFVKKIDNSKVQSTFGIVCDGVGSCPHSEIASKAAVSAYADWFLCCYPEIADMSDEEQFCSLLYERWFALFEAVNNYVLSFEAINNIQLGSTLSCVLVRNSNYYILHIGDTRIYSIDSEIEQLTSDHTVTAKELSRGIITPEQARKDNRRHTLTKCIGMKEHIRPEFYTGSISGSRKFLICSDGLRDRTDDALILRYMSVGDSAKKEKLVRAVKKVIRHSRDNGERDNITAVVIQVSED